ncbi:hypothetical protein BJ742DRAFT_792351 [Cladochytrium replicatum]|nr:hypothetical protein BJ742DRAFT_792351 [Cladochytrium replicatum]
MISNFFTRLPFLCNKSLFQSCRSTNPSLVLIFVIFSTISYRLINFCSTAEGFFSWVMWLFLDLVAAESLVRRSFGKRVY